MIVFMIFFSFSVLCFFYFFFFFFQAEDGIRDWSVTGVQTCALPICIFGLVAPFRFELLTHRCKRSLRLLLVATRARNLGSSGNYAIRRVVIPQDRKSVV